MAVGAYDANGVWINGEDDTYATFSARLNKSVESISTEIGNDRARLDTLEAEISAWTTYTPTFTGLVLGTGGTSFLRYRTVGGKVEVQFRFTFGTGGSWSNPSIPLPSAVLASITPQFANLGRGSAATAAVFYETTIRYFDSTVGARIYDLTGSPLTFVAIGGAAPFTPASGNTLSGEFTYNPV